ncbi:MAG: anthranilate phosphoribosyltransferase [Dehalococcoidales bacterium]|nr:anthranilate phosphoribosyltransferase [Dehalococcoidales bacterium]
MIKKAIEILVTGQSLTIEEASLVMEKIMQGEVTQAQFGALVTALRLKGETVEEIVGFAITMKSKAVSLSIDAPLVDTCGTGGDGAKTFNISTAAAFVAAGTGLKVAKHGNRAMSSRCGSADLLEELGIKIDLDNIQVKKCIEEIGIGFIFAPIFHPAMKYASVPRREIGIRTVFNILGPLTNPAGAKAQVLGVADAALVEKLALALNKLGCQHALVVHGDDGLDEITLTTTTIISELNNDIIKNYTITPEDFGLSRVNIDKLRGGTVSENAEILLKVLNGFSGPQQDVVVMNTAAVLLAGDRVSTFQDGVELAREVIENGKALEKLNQLINFSQGIVKEE